MYDMPVFDVFIVGTGAAGQNVASLCSKAGWRVGIVDNLPYGGTCALRGCDPKKVLLGAAEVVERFSLLNGKGLEGEVNINWSKLMDFKRTFTSHIPERTENWLSKSGIATYHGQAHFINSSEIKIGGDRVSSRFFVIASGAKPRDLKIKGEEHIVTSDVFLELDSLPEDITFIGGGYISFEFSHIAASAGANVRILHRSETPLKNFDKDLAMMLVENYRENDIDVRLNSPVKEVERKSDDTFIVRCAGGREFRTNLVVHGAGRVANVDNLNLEKAGVEYSEKGVKVNEYLQSVSNPKVYAAGDAADSGKPLTPVASYEGKIVAKNIIEGNKEKAKYGAIPSAVFTHPPLAAVGLKEEEANNAKVNFKETSNWYTSRRIGVRRTGYKVIVDNNGEHILGAHLLMPNADEIINIFALSIKHKLKPRDLKETIFTYPTTSSDIVYMI